MSTGLPELVSGQPGLLLVALSAKTVFHVFASRSAEAKVEALRKLLIKTKEAHREALYDLLPTLPPSHAKDPAFDCLSMRSFFLNSMSSRLTQLENKVASAGLWRWSPVYLGREILVISGELETLHENTLSTTATINDIITQLMQNSAPENWVCTDNPESNPLCLSPEPLTADPAGRV